MKKMGSKKVEAGRAKDRAVAFDALAAVAHVAHLEACNSESDEEIKRLKKQVAYHGYQIRAMRHRRKGVSSKEFNL